MDTGAILSNMDTGAILFNMDTGAILSYIDTSFFEYIDLAICSYTNLS